MRIRKADICECSLILFEKIGSTQSLFLENNNMIDIHADDYALTINTSKDMLECMKKGKLNSISVVPNMSCFDECMEMLYEAIPNLPFLPKISVHLDFVEGLVLTDRDNDLLKVSKDGKDLIGLTWAKLFVASYNPLKYGKLKAQLVREVICQIDRVDEAVKKCLDIANKNGIETSQQAIRIDSHQHSHMIPIVWNSLMEAAKEKGYRFEYIRNSKEPVTPFIGMTSLWKTYNIANIIKNFILNIYSPKVDRFNKKTGNDNMYMWGLIMSGNMDKDRVNKLLPSMINKAKNDNRTLEILFHPGTLLETEISNEIAEDAIKHFYMTKGRQKEYEAVMSLDLKKDNWSIYE